MALIRTRCPSCREVVTCPLALVAVFVCRDDVTRNRFGFTCPACGPQTDVLDVERFMLLNTSGVKVVFWTLAELEAESANLLREFADRLDDTLEQILSAA